VVDEALMGRWRRLGGGGREREREKREKGEVRRKEKRGKEQKRERRKVAWQLRDSAEARKKKTN
jgi:hypothetical protein